MTNYTNRQIAKRVKELRLCAPHHSLRALAEVICKEYPQKPIEDGWESAGAASGNQLYGDGLLRWAAGVLGEDWQQWEHQLDCIYSAPAQED